MARDWDAATYDRIADPQTRWGIRVLERLRLRGDELVLDAGCGTGRVTEALLKRLPQGHVVALDGSAAMIAEARRRLSPFGDRVRYVVAHLLEPLPIDPVDVILSTATFHWITDHDSLFRNLAAVLIPGGPLVAQCGGVGNLRSVERALQRLGAGGFDTKMFPTPERTTARLQEAGFVGVRCWLEREPTPFESGEPLERFLRTVILRHHLQDMSDEQAKAFSHDVAALLPEPQVDYVRLNIDARRS